MKNQPTPAPTTQPILEVGFLRQWEIIGCKKRGITPLIPVSRSTWLNGVATGIFPQPVNLGPKTRCWSIAVIRQFIENGGVL